MLARDSPQKSVFKFYIDKQIRAFHENEQRRKAITNEKLKYLNISLLVLSVCPQPAVSDLTNVN